MQGRGSVRAWLRRLLGTPGGFSGRPADDAGSYRYADGDASETPWQSRTCLCVVVASARRNDHAARHRRGSAWPHRRRPCHAQTAVRRCGRSGSVRSGYQSPGARYQPARVRCLDRGCRDDQRCARRGGREARAERPRCRFGRDFLARSRRWRERRRFTRRRAGPARGDALLSRRVPAGSRA